MLGLFPGLTFFHITGIFYASFQKNKYNLQFLLFPDSGIVVIYSINLQIAINNLYEYEPKRIPSKKWRECIKKIWEVDPLICPNCGGEMIKISAFNLHRGKHIQHCIL